MVFYNTTRRLNVSSVAQRRENDSSGQDVSQLWLEFYSFLIYCQKYDPLCVYCDCPFRDCPFLEVSEECPPSRNQASSTNLPVILRYM